MNPLLKWPPSENESPWADLSISAMKKKSLQFASFIERIPCPNNSYNNCKYLGMIFNGNVIHIAYSSFKRNCLASTHVDC